MKHTTETERIANEAFDRAMLNGAKFYVNGREWHPSAEEMEQFERFEQSALAAQERQGMHVASEQEQEDFWAGLPSHRMGLRRAPVDWWHVGGFLALFGLSVGISIAIVLGVRELWMAFK